VTLAVDRVRVDAGHRFRGTGVQVLRFPCVRFVGKLFEAGPRVVPSEDEDVSAAVATAFRASGIVVRENFGSIESFEKSPTGGE